MVENYPALTNVCVKMFGINVDGLPDVVINDGQAAVDWMNKWTPLARKAMARCIEETGKAPRMFLYEHVTKNAECISAMGGISCFTEWVHAGQHLEEKAPDNNKRLWDTDAATAAEVLQRWIQKGQQTTYAYVDGKIDAGVVLKRESMNSLIPTSDTLAQLGDSANLPWRLLERNQRGVPLMPKESAVALAKPYVHPRSLRGKVNVSQIMVDCPNGSDVCEEF